MRSLVSEAELGDLKPRQVWSLVRCSRQRNQNKAEFSSSGYRPNTGQMHIHLHTKVEEASSLIALLRTRFTPVLDAEVEEEGAPHCLGRRGEQL